jgi:ERF superfamily
MNELNELAKALSIAQGQMGGAKKDSLNPFFKSRYADLASVWEACREPLSKNGLCIIQTTEFLADSFVLKTTLLHSSGQNISGYYILKPVKDDPQGMGSAITYARRYALQSIIGICPEDDDGEAAHGRQSQQKQLHPKPVEQKPDNIPEPKQTKASVSEGNSVLQVGNPPPLGIKGLRIKDADPKKLDGFLSWAEDKFKPLSSAPKSVIDDYNSVYAYKIAIKKTEL